VVLIITGYEVVNKLLYVFTLDLELQKSIDEVMNKSVESMDETPPSILKNFRLVQSVLQRLKKRADWWVLQSKKNAKG